MHRSMPDHLEWAQAVTGEGLGELRELSPPMLVLATDRPSVAGLRGDLSGIPAWDFAALELLASGRAEALDLVPTIPLGLAQGR